MEEARFAREVLEVAILSIVCENVTEESLVQLRQNVRFQQLSQEPEMSGTFDLMELDNEFHRLLFHIAHKDNTVRMLEGLSPEELAAGQHCLSVITENIRNINEKGSV